MFLRPTTMAYCVLWLVAQDLDQLPKAEGAAAAGTGAATAGTGTTASAADSRSGAATSGTGAATADSRSGAALDVTGAATAGTGAAATSGMKLGSCDVASGHALALVWSLALLWPLGELWTCCRRPLALLSGPWLNRSAS